MTIRPGPAVTVGGVTIVPIEMVSWEEENQRRLTTVRAGLEPVALVVAGKDSMVAYDLDGARRDLDEVWSLAPGLYEEVMEHLARQEEKG